MTPAADHPGERDREKALTRIAGFYGMVDLAPGEGARAETLAGALLDGGAGVLQLRMKRANGAEMLAAARAVGALCRVRGATFIVNDRLDVALAADADGVHLGQEDLPLAAARALAPAGFLIGVSTHNEVQADEAAAAGADYLGFGPVFGTRTKENPDATVGLARLAAVCARVPVPVVAIGGITLAEIDAVEASGATAAAVIAAVNQAPEIVAAARAIGAPFARMERRPQRAAPRGALLPTLGLGALLGLFGGSVFGLHEARAELGPPPDMTYIDDAGAPLPGDGGIDAALSFDGASEVDAAPSDLAALLGDGGETPDAAAVDAGTLDAGTLDAATVDLGAAVDAGSVADLAMTNLDGGPGDGAAGGKVDLAADAGLRFIPPLGCSVGSDGGRAGGGAAASLLSAGLLGLVLGWRRARRRRSAKVSQRQAAR